tara:strand:+ start:996 stop:1244 length:249 start_codon:yes stop_codon:yes gene_type:complete
MERLKIYCVSYIEEGYRQYLFYKTKKEAEQQIASWEQMDEDTSRDYVVEVYPKTKDDLVDLLNKTQEGGYLFKQDKEEAEEE